MWVESKEAGRGRKEGKSSKELEVSGGRGGRIVISHFV